MKTGWRLAILAIVMTPLAAHAQDLDHPKADATTMDLTAKPEVEAGRRTRKSPLRFEVTMAEGLASPRSDGRLLVILNPKERPEPRLALGRVGMDAPPVLARDVRGFEPGVVATIDDSASTFPIGSLSRLPAGSYHIQAVFDTAAELRSPNAPGNLYSASKRVRLDAVRGGTITLELSREVPPEAMPTETQYLKYVRLRSDLLSAYHGRPIFLRAGVILPRDFDREPFRHYPLRVHIGGFGARFTEIRSLMAEGSAFRAAWLADDAPRMILLHLDGAGPWGDPYQVNSENHGPFGDAVTRELVPHVERVFRAIGEPRARVLDGSSTGGWVALALQIFYPESFNGAWACCPDSVDFRDFELINIYDDQNAYVNEHGFERLAARTARGDVRFTMRHECAMENTLGRGDSWARSGGQWGSWNATYGPRGADGLPVPLWDSQTGIIRREVAEHWKRYDLRMVLERDWPTLGPKLRGKIHVWAGEADDYFLNNAVHRLDAFLSTADPPFEGTMTFGPGMGHSWIGLSEREMMDQMARRVNE